MSETVYCQKYSIASGISYSSCNGFCCGNTLNQLCCYDSYHGDHYPAIGLGVAFGVTFSILLLIVTIFLCRAVCCPKKKRLVEPENNGKKPLIGLETTNGKPLKTDVFYVQDPTNNRVDDNMYFIHPPKPSGDTNGYLDVVYTERSYRNSDGYIYNSSN